MLDVLLRLQYRAENLGGHLGQGQPEHLDPGNRQDRHSPFRYILRKARNRKQHCDRDLVNLWELGSSQDDRCAIFKLAQRLPSKSLTWDRNTGDPWKPSMDRVDRGRGHERGKVRFVVMLVNLSPPH